MRDSSILLRLTVYTGAMSVAVIFFVSGGITPLQETTTWMSKQAQGAAVFFVTSITSAQIQGDYASKQVVDPITGVSTPIAAPAKRVRILIVPGHEPDFGGTDFGGVYERNIVVAIADNLASLLAQNPHYDVMVSRTKTAWNPILQTYFNTHTTEIHAFLQSQRAQMAGYLASGSILPAADQVSHNSTPSLATLQLYGINKWVSDNGYDIVLHLHINDEPRRHTRIAGKETGFAIYVPDHQYSNAAASAAIGDAIAARLNAYHATSTLPGEVRGVVPDQQLIAVGSNNSVDSATLLIEYGYIYEPQFQDASVRSTALADYAYETYLGLQDFFKDPPVRTYGSQAFPYDWSTVTGATDEHCPGVYALQSALHYLGQYPPPGRDFSSCPISGTVGDCTHLALEAYQRANHLTVTGTLGPQTRTALSRDTASLQTSSVTLR